MTEDHAEQRRTLLAAISDACEGEVVAGFVVIVECAGADGARSLQGFSSDALGDAELPTWTANGYLSYAIDIGMFDAVHISDDEDDD